MGVPRLVGELDFEDGIYSVAANLKGDMIAVGSKGILGLYEVKRLDGETRFSHSASFVLADNPDCPITDVTFGMDGETLILKAEDGKRRTLSLGQKENGMLTQIAESHVDAYDESSKKITNVIEVSERLAG